MSAINDAETKRLVDALHCARAALRGASAECRYHGSDFDFMGFERGEPRCDSCKQPHKVAIASRAVDDALRRVYEPAPIIKEATNG